MGSYPPRQKSKMAEIAGCEDADEFPQVLAHRLLKVAKANPSCMAPNEWQKFAERAEMYSEQRADHPFYIEDGEELWGELAKALKKNAGMPVLKRPAASSGEA